MSTTESEHPKGVAPQSTGVTTARIDATNPDTQVLQLWCFDESDSQPFLVVIPSTADVYQLNILVREEREKGLLRDVDPADLELWKVSHFQR
jgi:hypothetical protein